VNEPSLLRYSWTGDQGGDVTQVVYRLEPHAGGTRFSYDHTGFTGVGGVFMATLLGHVRSKMLNVGLPPVLDDLDEGKRRGEDASLAPTGSTRASPGRCCLRHVPWCRRPVRKELRRRCGRFGQCGDARGEQAPHLILFAGI